MSILFKILSVKLKINSLRGCTRSDCNQQIKLNIFKGKKDVNFILYLI